jgi:hypothetical protein
MYERYWLCPTALLLLFLFQTAFANVDTPEKFVIFAREGDWHNMTASVWECDPSRSHNPIARKHTFAESHLSPGMFFPDSTDNTNQLVRLQINDDPPPGNYFVRLYRVDYTNWTVDLILESDQMHPLGYEGHLVYIYTDKGVKRLDMNTCKIEHLQQQFTRIWKFDHFWIVRMKDSPADLTHVFDLNLHTTTKSFTLPPWYEIALDAVLSPNGRFLAVCGNVDHNKMVSPCYLPAISLPTSIFLVDIQTNKNILLPVNIYSCPGSGRPILPFGFDLWFPDNEHFKYTSAVKEAHIINKEMSTEQWNTLVEQVCVDLKTMKLAKGPHDFRNQKSRNSVTIWIPQFLELYRPEINDYHDLAHTFLKHMGLKYEVPVAWCDTNVGFSDDGKRFLLKMSSSAESADFIYGDLEAKEYKKIAPPQDFTEISDMKIYAVKK